MGVQLNGNNILLDNLIVVLPLLAPDFSYFFTKTYVVGTH